jgi:hypothetical protein
MLLLCSCTTSKEYKIIAKWGLKKTNMNVILCQACDTNSRNCCLFKYKGEIYNRTESFILDLEGKIDSLYSYQNPNGVTINSIAELGKLWAIDTLAYNDLVNTMIKWDKRNQKIKDGEVSYGDYEIDKEQNYLIVKRGDELNLYEYERR